MSGFEAVLLKTGVLLLFALVVVFLRWTGEDRKRKP